MLLRNREIYVIQLSSQYFFQSMRAYLLPVTEPKFG